MFLYQKPLNSIPASYSIMTQRTERGRFAKGNTINTTRARNRRGQYVAQSPVKRILAAYERIEKPTFGKIITETGASRSLVEYTVTVRRKASGALVKMMEEGKISSYAAYDFMRAVPDWTSQEEAIEKGETRKYY
jgi:hypothetical protein